MRPLHFSAGKKHPTQVMRTGYVNARELKPIMPWWAHRGMTDENLKAMFAYLRTVPPIKHRVDNTAPPTPCRICGGVHGAGDRNWSRLAPGPEPRFPNHENVLRWCSAKEAVRVLP